MSRTVPAVLASLLLTALASAAAAQASSGPALSVRPRAMIALSPTPDRTAMWERHPSWDEIQAAAPEFARKHRIDGRAVLNCRVDSAGYLGSCAVEAAEPRGAGFDGAALKLAPYFKLWPRVADGRAVAGGQVRVPILFGSTPS